MNNIGISKPTVTLILLIISMLIFTALTAMWMSPAPYESVGLTITPTIYSTECNLGILNELAIFEMYIWNELPTNEDFEITITADDQMILNKMIEIDANSSRNETISQRLSDIGMWIVRGSHNQETVDSYSFKTLTNKIEADIEIQALEESERKANQEFIILVLTILGSIGAVITTIIAVLTYRKKNKSKTNYQAPIDY